MKAFYRISLFFNIMTVCALIIWCSAYLTERSQKASDGIRLSKDAGLPQTADASNTGAQNGSLQKVSSGDSALLPSQNTDTALSDGSPAEQSETTPVIGKEEVATSDTIYFVSSYDMTTEVEQYSEEKLPAAYIGKTRQQIADLIHAYNQTPALDDVSKGFVEMSLDSFSAERISVLKVYESDSYFGCLVVEDGYLSVYDEDREHVIIYTDILFDKLPQDMKQQILDGKYFKTEDELYHFLESYSS